MKTKGLCWAPLLFEIKRQIHTKLRFKYFLGRFRFILTLGCQFFLVCLLWYRPDIASRRHREARFRLSSGPFSRVDGPGIPHKKPLVSLSHQCIEQTVTTMNTRSTEFDDSTAASLFRFGDYRWYQGTPNQRIRIIIHWTSLDMNMM